MHASCRSILLLVLAVVAMSLCSCQGPDPIRLKSERANWALMQRCADGWFQGLPATPHDQQLVRDAAARWDAALKADEALVGWPVGGVR